MFRKFISMFIPIFPVAHLQDKNPCNACAFKHTQSFKYSLGQTTMSGILPILPSLKAKISCRQWPVWRSRALLHHCTTERIKTGLNPGHTKIETNISIPIQLLWFSLNIFHVGAMQKNRVRYFHSLPWERNTLSSGSVDRATPAAFSSSTNSSLRFGGGSALTFRLAWDRRKSCVCPHAYTHLLQYQVSEVQTYCSWGFML